MAVRDRAETIEQQMRPEDLPPRPLRHHLALTVYWLSNTLLWGALFHQGLGLRLGTWFPESRVGYYFGLLGFLGGVIGTATQIVVGALSDRSLNRWGRRRPYLALGSLLGAGALLLMGNAASYWPFAGALMLVQFLTNIALGPFTALLPDTVNPREHGKASGFMGAARLLGDTGGMILAGVLLSLGPVQHASSAVQLAYFDHRMFLLCALAAAFTVATMLFTCWTIRERPLKSRPHASTRQIIARSFAVDVRGNADFFWLSLSRAVTNLGFYMFLETVVLFLKYTIKDPDPARANMLVMLPAIGAAVASSVPSGVLSDRLGRRRLIFIAQFLMAIGAAGYMLAPNLAVLYIAGVPAGLAYGAFTAVEWALACNLLPAGDSARYLGVWNASAVLPQVFGFVIAGAVGSAISAHVPGLGWRVDFGLAILCCLLGAYFLIPVRERRAAPAEETA